MEETEGVRERDKRRKGEGERRREERRKRIEV